MINKNNYIINNLIKTINAVNFIPQYKLNEEQNICYSFYSCFSFKKKLYNLVFEIRQFRNKQGYILVSIVDIDKKTISLLKRNFSYIESFFEYDFGNDIFHLEKSFLLFSNETENKEFNDFLIFLNSLKVNNDLFPYVFE